MEAHFSPVDVEQEQFAQNLMNLAGVFAGGAVANTIHVVNETLAGPDAWTYAECGVVAGGLAFAVTFARQSIQAARLAQQR